jgi:hypothetical protein
MAILRSFALGLLACAVPAFAVPRAPSEYQVKAVFLFNFAQFVEWPQESFAAADAPFTICVLGEDPFGAHLDDAVKGEAVQGHPLAVRRYGDAAQVDSCHILFIGGSKLGELDGILAMLKGRATLTVSDIDRSAERGAIIQFSSDRNRLRLRINIEEARSAGLVLSSKLLRPAEIVGEGRG